MAAKPVTDPVAKARLKAGRDLAKALASVRAWVTFTRDAGSPLDPAVDEAREMVTIVSDAHATWRRAANRPLKP